MRKQIFRRGHGKLFARRRAHAVLAFNLHGWPVIEMESRKMRAGWKFKGAVRARTAKMYLVTLRSLMYDLITDLDNG